MAKLGGVMIVGLAAVALSACASLPACPAEGGPKWTEWQTPSFRLFTPIDEAHAEELVTSFEELRRALLLAAWRGGARPIQPIDVVVLRDRSEFDVFAPFSVGGYVTTLGPAGAVIATYAGLVLMEDVVLKHELTHALAHQFGIERQAPDWFSEGLAEYLSTVRYVGDGTRVRFGDLSPDRQRELDYAGPLRFEQLWLPRAVFAPRFYATSWLLVHYLFNHEPRRFEAFQRALSGGGGARQAWDSAFAGFGGAEVDATLANYMRGGKFMSYEAARPKLSFSVVSQEIGDSEVHALLSLLYATGPAVGSDRPSLTRAEVERALKADPLNLRAAVVERFYLRQRRGDVATARQLVERNPDSSEAWALLALAHRTLGQLREAAAVTDQARARGLPMDATPVPHIARPY